MTRPRATRDLLREAAARLRTEPTLRWSMAGWAVLGLGGAVGGAVAAGAMAGPHGLRAVGSLGPLVGLAWWGLVSLGLAAGTPLLVEVPAGRRLDRIGVPNGLTALRAYGCAPVVLLALLPDRTLGRELFLAVASPVALLDAADGYIARRAQLVTILGRALDPVMDSLFFAVCGVASLVLGFIPLWFAVLVLGRYGLPGIAFALVYPRLRRRPTMVATSFGKAGTLLISFALLGSALLVLAGGPALPFQIGVAIPIAVAAVGHLAVLVRRTRLAASDPGEVAAGA